MRCYPKREPRRGAVVPLIAISMPVVLGFVALVLDLGGMFEARRVLQESADAGAVSGATEFWANPSATDTGAAGYAASVALTNLNYNQQLVAFNTNLIKGTLPTYYNQLPPGWSSNGGGNGQPWTQEGIYVNAPPLSGLGASGNSSLANY